MVGGWVQAAHVPADQAFALAEHHLKERTIAAHAQSLQIWASSLSAYSKAPDPPEPPDFDD